MSDFIKTAVIGHPISHSKSPLIHNHWIAAHHLSGEYKAIDVAPENLERDIKALVEDGYKGFNVTVPHKVAIMDLCEDLDDTARAIGAVNTVAIKDGKLYGSNTDAYGFTQNIKENAPDGWAFQDGKALVLGAGGAANAIVYALLQEGVQEIILTNRTRAKAEALAQMNPQRIKVIEWDNRSDACAETNLIVNTTALGMKGQPALDIDISAAPQSALVTDIVYAPLITDLLAHAQKREMNIITGIGMLLHQARPGFELWNGVLPEVTSELEKLVLS